MSTSPRDTCSSTMRWSCRLLEWVTNTSR
uniref:Uncharacterized protein n=1 Tax=Rhizophora mucronata TaxID=61149 RepID=A0A2P2K9C6_RHIMU